MKSNEEIIHQIAKTCINSINPSLHLGILHEMFGFDGILSFSQTIKDLITLDQMSVFGISEEMQIVLKHINQLKMLNHMPAIRKSFQREYEKFHSRTIVTVQIGGSTQESVNDILQKINEQFDGTHDIIYQSSSISGISIRYKDNIVECTSNTIAGMLKVA